METPVRNMNFAEIENIIIKKITREASTEELQLLDDWAKESMSNKDHLDSYNIIWDTAKEYTPSNFIPKTELAFEKHLELLEEEQPAVIKEFIPVSESSNSTSKTKFFTLQRISSIAAVFIVAFAAVFLLRDNSTTINSGDTIQYVSLEDGSGVWLDKQSSISTKEGFGVDHRNLILAGKAFFDVERNESLPFTISSDDLNVAVLGTSFTIDGTSGKNVVSVKSGKVNVQSKNQNVDLTANQMVSLENNKLIQRSSSSDEAKWRNSKLTFDEAPIEQVIADINLYYNNKIQVVENSSNINCTLTSGSLLNESFDTILKVLESNYDLEITSQEGGVASINFIDCK